MPKTVSNSSIAVEHDIICKRGDTFWRGFEYYSDAAYTAPIDITASTFRLEVIETKSKKPVLTFEDGDGLSITAPNILEIEKTAAEMLIESGAYKYDLEKTLSDGTVTTIMKGQFIVESDITE